MSQPTLLAVDGVSVSFDGFRALNNLSLVLEEGEMRAVIGPNGAGKTTMMDVITGKTRPDSGKRHFLAPDVRSRPAWSEPVIAAHGYRPEVSEADRVRAESSGLGKSAELAMKTDEGLAAHHALGDRNWIVRHERDRIEEIAAQLIASRSRCHAASGRRTVSHGQKQRLEIGMLLDAAT